MSEPERRSRVACWRRPSEMVCLFSGVGGCAAGFAHFWGRRRGDVLLGWCWVSAGFRTLRVEDSGGRERSRVGELTD